MSKNLTLVRNNLNYYKQIFENNNDPKNLNRLQWMHENNPMQKKYFSVYIDEENTNKPAALYAVFPVFFKEYNNIVNAVQSIDTITDVDYRGMGLFKKLAVDCYANCKNDGVQFVYGFPNDQSAPGFFKSLGWKPIAEVPFMIKPVNLFFPFNYIFKKNIPFFLNINVGLKKLFLKKAKAFQVKDITVFDEGYNELWNKYSKDVNICVNRNAAYMNWRIINHPTEKYIVKGCYLQNQLIAVCVCTIANEKHGGKIGYVLETIYDPQFFNEAKHFFNTVIKQIFYKAKVDVVLSWCFPHSHNYALYKSGGFYNLPKKMQKIKLFFGANNFKDADNAIFFNKGNWYLSYCDSDTV